MFKNALFPNGLAWLVAISSFWSTGFPIFLSVMCLIVAATYVAMYVLERSRPLSFRQTILISTSWMIIGVVLIAVRTITLSIV